MDRARNISKSMISYLKRAREQKEFLLKETKEFERGKRHLAHMMGIESEAMTQADVDEAITYLFPSGLFDKRARPSMRHPDFIYKAQKDAQFDVEGRPFHHLFYTSLPNYYACMGEIGKLVRELNKYEDEQIARGVINPNEDTRYRLSGKEWISHQEFCDKLIENVTEADYKYFTDSLTRLMNHPYSSRVESFLGQYTKDLPGQSFNLKLPELLKDEETGHIYTEIISKHREHKVKVKTILNGSGIFNYKGHDVLFFDAPYMRRSILFPMQISGMQDKIDVYAHMINEDKLSTIGQGSIATAIRYAISVSIGAYVDPETRERMRLNGLLTPDPRTRERKKFGQEGARRKYTWKKR